ncbi:MAG: hypothetical protein MHPSP_001715, partial [Paramarteilia canceri]
MVPSNLLVISNEDEKMRPISCEIPKVLKDDYNAFQNNYQMEKSRFFLFQCQIKSIFVNDNNLKNNRTIKQSFSCSIE